MNFVCSNLGSVYASRPPYIWASPFINCPLPKIFRNFLIKLPFCTDFCIFVQLQATAAEFIYKHTDSSQGIVTAGCTLQRLLNLGSNPPKIYEFICYIKSPVFQFVSLHWLLVFLRRIDNCMASCTLKIGK